MVLVSSLGSVVMIVYVDDNLIASSSKAAEEKVVQSMAAIVPTKTPGAVLPAALGGGSLQSIGRTIETQRRRMYSFVSFPSNICIRRLRNSKSRNPVLFPTFPPI